MEILPVRNTSQTVESTRHDQQQQSRKRQPEPRNKKIAPSPVYTPAGQMEQQDRGKIDIVA
jgi:hypothetical protein